MQIFVSESFKGSSVVKKLIELELGVDICEADGEEQYEELMKEVLRSTILIVSDFDSKDVNKVAIFSGSLETLNFLKIKHSPKLIVKVTTGGEYSHKFIEEATEKWGVTVSSIPDLIKIVGNFLSTYPI